MSLSKLEAKQLVERLVYGDERPQDWAQDVWEMSPTLGETAAKLVEVFDVLVDSCPPEMLENLLLAFYQTDHNGAANQSPECNKSDTG